MSDTIIAAYDGSAGARDALALATVLADADPARPTHITVTSVYRYTPVGDPSVAGEYERLFRDAAEEKLAEARKALGDRGDASFRVVRGTSAAEGLHRVAAAEGASAIIVGGSHTGTLGRVLPGSVTEQTLHGAPCAVAVAPAGYADAERRIRTVGVAFDDSTEARHALGIAVDLAARFGAALRIVRVLDEQIVWYGGYAGPGAMADIRDYVRETVRQAEASVEGVDDVSGILLEGSVPVRLAEASRSLDLLVVGSRGHGPIRRVLLGSVSARLARESACPLVAVPHSDVPAQEETAAEDGAVAPATA